MRQATGVPDTRRARLGIFDIDRLLGGGLPINKISLLYGNASTFKTTISLRTMWNFIQRCGKCLFPHSKCTCETPDDNTVIALIDIDEGYEEQYLINLDIDPKRVYVYKPQHGEAACEVAREFAQIPEVRGVIVDTLDNMVSLNDLEKGFLDSLARAERAKLINRMMRSLIPSLESNIPRLSIMLNHPFPLVNGRPGHWLPGGEAQTNIAHVTIHLWAQGKSKSVVKIEDELSGEIPARKREIGFHLKKSRISADNITGEFSLFTEEIPEQNIRYGDADDFQSVTNWAAKLGLISMSGKKYAINGTDLGPQQIVKYWKLHKQEYLDLQEQIFATLKVGSVATGVGNEE